MSDRDSPDALLAAVTEITDRIAGENAERERLYGERRDLFRRCLDAGISRTDVAKAARLTPMAINFAVGAKEPRPAAKPA